MRGSAKLAVRFVLAFVAVAAAAAALVVGAGALLLPDLCGAEVRRVVASPGGRHRAVVSVGSCGATTGFTGNVSVVGPRGTPPADNRGNALRVRDPGPYPDGPCGEARSAVETIEVRWAAADSLVVEYDRCGEVVSRADAVRGVRVLARPVERASPASAPAGQRVPSPPGSARPIVARPRGDLGAPAT